MAVRTSRETVSELGRFNTRSLRDGRPRGNSGVDLPELLAGRGARESLFGGEGCGCVPILVLSLPMNVPEEVGAVL
jgi:hypothetical protein